MIKMVDYWKHYKNSSEPETDHKSTVSVGADDDESRVKHAKVSQGGMLISGVAFCLIVTNMVLLPRHPKTSGMFFNLYFILMVFVQIPMLHYMIVNQENKQQIQSRERMDSWVVN